MVWQTLDYSGQQVIAETRSKRPTAAMMPKDGKCQGWGARKKMVFISDRPSRATRNRKKVARMSNLGWPGWLVAGKAGAGGGERILVAAAHV